MQPRGQDRPAAAAGSFALTSPEPEPQTLSGLIERVAFHNAETGFCVLRVKLAEQREPATVVGECARVAPGEVVRADGGWQHQPELRRAVPRAHPGRGAAEHARGHRGVSRLGHDQGHRPGHGQEAGHGVRRSGVRGDRAPAAAAARGARASAAASPHGSRAPGASSGRCATSCCSCTRMGSARCAPRASSRPTASARSRRSARTRIGSRATSAASASTPPTSWPSASASRRTRRFA